MLTKQPILAATATTSIELEHRRRTPKSAALHEAALDVLPGGDTRTSTYFAPYPVFIERGVSCRLTDVDGNEYLDFLNNYTSLIHGHSHPRITEVVSQQLLKGTAYAAPLELQIQLARLLCTRVVSIQQIRFCNSGTEATMYAIRAAKAFTGRDKILKMEGGYHGSHDAAEISRAPSVNGAGPADAPYSLPSAPGLFRGVVQDVVIVPFNNIEATARALEYHKNDLAAVIVEPMMGAAGSIPAAPEYLRFLREATRRLGVLLIFDEVITFRLAYGGAQELYAITPDLTALGKIIGGGFPVGAFGGREDIMAQFDPRQVRLHHFGTFNGNAITMAAGLASLGLLTRDEVARINQLGEHLRTGLRSACVAAGIVAQVTGIGSITAIHFTGEKVCDYRSAERASKHLLPLLHLGLLNRGLFVAPRGEFVISTPMRMREIDTALRAFSATLDDIRSIDTTRY
jgi:glutamate-1-semialdehyde 2,1-aminomutase